MKEACKTLEERANIKHTKRRCMMPQLLGVSQTVPHPCHSVIPAQNAVMQRALWLGYMLPKLMTLLLVISAGTAWLPIGRWSTYGLPASWGTRHTDMQAFPFVCWQVPLCSRALPGRSVLVPALGLMGSAQEGWPQSASTKTLPPISDFTPIAGDQ